MQLIRPDESVDHFRQRLPNDGRRFLLRDALNALQDFYSNVRFSDCDDDDDMLVAVAGKFGNRPERRFDIGLYRSFGLMGQLEILLRYPVTLRCLFINCVSELCDSPRDLDRFFATVRASRWYRRYASIAAMDCSVRWLGEEEMGDILCEIVPELTDVLGPNL